MARFEHLSIYKTAYDLFRLVGRLVQNMPKSVKPIHGMEMHRGCVEIISQVWRANDATDSEKVPHINRLIDRIRQIELLLRVSRDDKCISIPQYAKAVKLSESVSRQAYGWKNRYESPVT